MGENIGGARAYVLQAGGGRGAVTVGVYVGISNVNAYVDGHITASSMTNFTSLQIVKPSDISPYVEADLETNPTVNTIHMVGHGYVTGDIVIYNSADFSQPFGELANGHAYMVFVLPSPYQDYFRLVSVDTTAIDLSKSGVNSGSVHLHCPGKNFDLHPWHHGPVE